MWSARLVSDERPDVTHELMVLRTWPERLKGLLGTGRDASPVLLVRCASVHTFGMTYPLDLAFVGETGEVLQVVCGVDPGECVSHPMAFCVMERPTCGDDWPEEGEHLWIASVGLGAAVA